MLVFVFSLFFVCLFVFQYSLVKVWKRKLEEEYNPYALELEKSAAADMGILNLEDDQ